MKIQGLRSFQRQIKLAKNIFINMFIMGDMTLHMLESRDQISLSRNCQTMPLYKKLMEDYGLCLKNKKRTWIRGNLKSLIDHITTNMHTHIYDITTSHSGISNHSMVSFNYQKCWQPQIKPNSKLRKFTVSFFLVLINITNKYGLSETFMKHGSYYQMALKKYAVW